MLLMPQPRSLCSFVGRPQCLQSSFAPEVLATSGDGQPDKGGIADDEDRAPGRDVPPRTDVQPENPDDPERGQRPDQGRTRAERYSRRGMSSMTLMELRGEAEMLGIELGAKETRGSAHVEDPRHHSARDHRDDLGAIQGDGLQGCPGELCPVGLARSRGERRQHASRSTTFCELVEGPRRRQTRWHPRSWTCTTPRRTQWCRRPPGSSAAWSVVTPSRGYSSKPVLPGVQATAKEHTTSDRGGGPISHGTGRPRRHPGGDHGAGDQTGPPAGRPWRQQLRSDGTGGKVDDATGNTKVQF